MTLEQMAAIMAELDIDSSDEEEENILLAPPFTTGETKQGDTATNSHSNTNRHLSYLVQPRLHGRQQRLPSLKVLWIRIFSYSGPTEKETVSFRCLCKLFSKALKPLPCWTSYPHPNYSSLGALLNRFTALSKKGSINLPSFLLIENGIHDEGGRCIHVKIPISIVGESREHCIVIGGLEINGKKEDDVTVQDLTLRESKGSGICGFNGASVHLDNLSVENSGSFGVVVSRTKRNSMKNCNVSHSKYSGLVVYHGGSMTIDGNATTIHHNCVSGYGGYGLYADGSSSSIFLVSPLTKEMISTNNGGSLIGCFKSRNFKGTINTIKTTTL